MSNNNTITAQYNTDNTQTHTQTLTLSTVSTPTHRDNQCSVMIIILLLHNTDDHNNISKMWIEYNVIWVKYKQLTMISLLYYSA